VPISISFIFLKTALSRPRIKYTMLVSVIGLDNSNLPTAQATTRRKVTPPIFVHTRLFESEEGIQSTSNTARIICDRKKWPTRTRIETSLYIQQISNLYQSPGVRSCSLTLNMSSRLTSPSFRSKGTIVVAFCSPWFQVQLFKEMMTHLL